MRKAQYQSPLHQNNTFGGWDLSGPDGVALQHSSDPLATSGGGMGQGEDRKRKGRSSIAGTKMIPFASYKAPQTQSRLPSPTK